MKWIKERDALIAQTKAFVQSVTGRTPQEAIDPSVVVVSRAEPVRMESSVFSTQPAPLEPAASFEPIEKVEQPSALVLEAPPARVLPQSDVRKEIQSRVAA